MFQADIEKFKGTVETGCCEPSLSMEQNMLASIAISMKRIADMMDGTTIGINCAETIFNPLR